MVKFEETVIREFNELVNMTASELEEWLDTEIQPVRDGRKMMGVGRLLGMTGISFLSAHGLLEDPNHDTYSGTKIVEILKKNLKKDPEKYDEDDLQHMRKVVAYCKRHLAQEESAKKNTDSKSYKSLKNWGHDAQKA
ncbi:hypothetical protein B0O99DRAFT_684859 [Bisporella sp. PMI_857]|nr:hypothetical protein B0O99DRAFT_684859 [Bisporella sp. PMI_857]